jgi:large subunit ribosomal protein L19
MRLSQLFKTCPPDTTKSLYALHPGDTIRRNLLSQKGYQIYQGTLISQRRRCENRTIKIRRSFQGVGLERTFPIYSPLIQNLEVRVRVKSRRAKLYYLRKLNGKAIHLNTKKGKRPFLT